jgi:hypothetical protein
MTGAPLSAIDVKSAGMLRLLFGDLVDRINWKSTGNHELRPRLSGRDNEAAGMTPRRKYH